MSDQQFVLRWHYHNSTVLGNLPILLESDVLTDLTISIGHHCVRAHRLVLAMCSTYFFQLFQEMGNSQNPVIVLHNVTLEEIKAVLSFVYRGHCTVSRKQIPGLLSVAKLLKIQGLCDMNVPENLFNNAVGEIEKNNNINENRNDLKPDVPDITPIEDIDGIEPDTKNMCKSIFIEPQSDAVTDLQTPKKACREITWSCKCFLCGKYLSNQYNLRVHMETHEEAYHACLSCPHVSRSRDALRKHVSYRHPDECTSRKRKKAAQIE